MSGTSTPRQPDRVLHVLKYYRPAFTGEGVFLERSSAVMQEIAPDVEHDLLVTHTTEPAEPAEAAACSTLARVVYLAARPLGTVRREARLVWWFLCNLRRYRTVHFRTHADWYFMTYLLTRLFGRRLVLSATLDDSLPNLISQYRPSLRPFAALGFRLFHAYVSISPKLLAETRSAAVDPAHCHLVPCGITAPPQPPEERARLRGQLGFAPEEPVLLFVGGLCARKDPLFLVDALPRLRARHPTMRLVLVGPPLEADYVQALHRAVAQHGLEGSVVFAGEQLNPHPWFAAADIVVFASRLEGFGTVVPEGMAHGRPVVVRRLPGVNDSFVLEGETGYLFDDEDGFVAAIDRLAADPSLRRRIGASAQDFATTQFGMRGIAARYLDIYGLAARILPETATLPETGLACAASLPDRRFHSPVAAASDAQPLLLTTIDAEESFDWGQPFSRAATDVQAMGCQHLAHRVFDRHGVVPIYLADYPVATQDAGRAPLLELLQDGRCEIGAQLHPWVTPPFLEEVNERNSYVANLPTGLEFEKARHLTEALEAAFGTAPRVYRTGRFGAGRRTADILKRLGYLVDSSLSVCWPPEGSDRQPGLWSLTARPHWIDRERTLLEMPVSAALVGRLARPWGRLIAPLVFHPLAQRLALGGAMSKFGLLERIRLSPEGMTLDEAKRLVRFMIADGHRVFVLTYHSPSLAPGNTPYTRSEDDVRRFLDWLDAFYSFFREEVGGRPATWREVRFGNAANAAPEPRHAAAPA